MNSEEDKKKINIKPPEGATLVAEPEVQRIKILPPKDAVVLTEAELLEKKKTKGIVSEPSLKEFISGLPSTLIEKEPASSTRVDVNIHPLLDPAEIAEIPPLSVEEFEEIVSKKKAAETKDYTTINDYLTDKKAYIKELGLSDDINVNRKLREGEQELFDVRLESSDTYQARKRANESYFWGTLKAINYGTASFFRTLDNACIIFDDVTGLEGRSGWFGDIAEKIESVAEVMPDVPDTRIGRLCRNVGGLEGLFLELIITPSFKIKRIGTIPKIFTQMTGSGFVNRYAEELDRNPESTKKFIEGVKGAGGGAKDAAILIALGCGSGKVAQTLLKSTGIPTVAAVSRMGTMGVGFGGANAAEQLIVKGDIDWREVEGAFDIGLVFGIKDVADYAMKRAVGNYITSSPKAEKAAKEIKADVKDLRDKAAEFREKSKGVENIEEKAGLEMTADAVDFIADVKIISKEIGKKPEEWIEKIEKDAELSERERGHYRIKIEETAADADPKITKAKIVQSEIEDLKRQGEFWEKNETVGEEVKGVKIEDIESKIKEKKIEIDNILKEPALGEPSYEIYGKKIEKKAAKEMIEKAEKIEDIETLKITNDPGLDKLLRDKFKTELKIEEELTEEEIKAIEEEADIVEVTKGKRKIIKEGEIKEEKAVEKEYTVEGVIALFAEQGITLDPRKWTENRITNRLSGRYSPFYDKMDDNAIRKIINYIGKLQKKPAKETIVEKPIKVKEEISDAERIRIEAEKAGRKEKVESEEEKRLRLRHDEKLRLEAEKKEPLEEGTSKWIAEKSEDVNEIRAAWERESLETPEKKLTPAEQQLLGQRVNPESFNRFGDPNFVTKGIARSWFTKKGEKSNIHDIDVIAQEISKDNKIEFTPQDVVDFIVSHPGNYARKTADLQRSLARRFREVAGYSIKNREFVDVDSDLADFNKFSEKYKSEYFTLDDFMGLIEKRKGELKHGQYEKFKTIVENEKKESREGEEAFREVDEEAERKREEIKKPEEERIRVKKEEAKGKIAVGTEDLMTSMGLIKLAEGAKKPDAVRALRNITEGVYDLGVANVEELIIKVKQFMADKIKDENQRKRIFDFIDGNRDEIGKIYDERSKKVIREEKVDKKKEAIKANDDVSFALDIDSKRKTFIQKWFTSKGVFPKWLFERKIMMQSDISAALTQVRYTTKDFKKAVKKHYGVDKVTGKIKIPKEDIEKFDRVLKGEVPYSELPTEGIAKVLGEMRNQVRELSLRFMNEGLVEGELLAKIGENLDTYLTRSYEVHDNPKWKNKVPDEIKNNAIKYLRGKKRYRDKSDAEMKGIINELLDSKDSPFNIISGAKLGSKDLGILMKKKDIAPEIRALLGEYKDPLMNYTKSVVRMVNYLERSHFLEDIKETGMNDVFFEDATETHYRKIAAKGTKTIFPLNDLYTTPAIAEAFEMFSKTEPFNWYTRGYMKINGVVKYSKTIASLMTHVRNFLANTGFAVMNAHWRAGEFAPAIKSTFTHLAKLNYKEWRKEYKKYIKEGIVQQSVRGGEIHDIMKDAARAQGDYSSLTDNRLNKSLRKGLKALEGLYMAEDDVWKIYSRENEYAKYRKAYPEWSEAEVVKKAGEITRNVTPTYSMVPEFFKRLRRFPLVGTFVSFPAEVFRTMYNTVELTHKELSDPKTRKIGAERLAGLITASVATAGLSAFSRYIYHVDDDQYTNVRRFLPPWSRNSDLLVLSEPKDGIIYYVDLGYCDPHNYLKNPVNALIMGDDPMGEKAMDALRELAEPFLGEELLASKLIDISRNKKKESGAPIYNEQDTWGNQMSAKVEYLMKAMEPGTLSNFRKIFKGIHGTIDETYGKKYDSVTEMVALFSGQRVAKVDAGDSFSFKAYAFEKNYTDAKRIYNRVAYRRTPPSTKSQENRALRNANRAMEELVNEISKDYHAAMGIGVKEKDLIAVLKRNRGISNRLIVDIARGEYVKWIPPEKIAYK